MAFALWLVSGAYSPVLKWSAVGLFVLFAAYNVHRWLGGYATCGCFGAVSIPPWLTLLVDLGVIGLFLASPVPSLPNA